MPSVKYRCPKCRHRLEGDESRCGHCAKNIDWELAEVAAVSFRRKQDGYFNRMRRLTFINLAILAALAVMVVVGVLMVVNFSQHP